MHSRAASWEEANQNHNECALRSGTTFSDDPPGRGFGALSHMFRFDSRNNLGVSDETGQDFGIAPPVSVRTPDQ